MKSRILLVALAGLVLFGCKSQNEPEQPSQNVIAFSVVQSNGAAQSAVRRVSTNGKTFATTFTTGDKAGVFAVKDGKVIDAVNNLCLTLNSAGTWVPTHIVPYTEQLGGAQFYAYFPYQEKMTLNLTAEDPFADVLAAHQPAADQSTDAAYASADIMTSAAAALGENRTVRLNVQHRMALVSIEMPNKAYQFTNEGLSTYVLTGADSIVFTLGTTTVQPYFDEQAQRYRFIVRPQSDQTLTISYQDNGAPHTAEITNLADVWAGEFAHYAIDGGADITVHTLQVGDYLLTDGTLVSKDDAEAISAHQADIAAVVYALGTNPGITDLRPACSHGIAVALTEKKDKWGTIGSTTSEQNAAGWSTWFTQFGMAGLGTSKNNEIDLNSLVAVGYEYTMKWVSVPVDMEIGGLKADINSVFAATYAAWAEANPMPAATTEWFIPSLRDWMNIREANDAVAASLAAIGATDFQWNTSAPEDKQYYWSSNLRGSAAMWCYTGFGTTNAELIQASGNKDSRFYRFAIAF